VGHSLNLNEHSLETNRPPCDTAQPFCRARIGTFQTDWALGEKDPRRKRFLGERSQEGKVPRRKRFLGERSQEEKVPRRKDPRREEKGS
jgi:hypothetical protein